MKNLADQRLPDSNIDNEYLIYLRRYSMKKILVLGGTGMLGAPVVRQLAKDGFAVRLMARDAAKANELFTDGVEIFEGDVTDQDALSRCLAGSDGVHISVGGPVDLLSAANVSALAPKHNIKRILYISGSTVCEENSWFPMTDQKWKAEQAILACGVPYTILCPTWPMEQLPRFIVGGRATLIGEKPVPWHWFAAADLARMVSNAFQSDAAVGKRLYIHGPESMTMYAALQRTCAVLHPEIEEISVMPVEVAKNVAESTGNKMLGFFAALMDYFQQVGELGDPTEANAILGAPTLTLEDWLQDGV
jgi:uncharacterized protein YbjT (DUF2867 family)